MADDDQLAREPAPQPQRPRSSWRRRLFVGAPCVGLLIGLWWVLWGRAADLPEEPVTIHRGPDGEFQQVADDSAGLKAHLSSLKSQQTATTASSSFSSNASGLRAGSAVVSVAGSGVLAQRVADELFQELQESRFFQTLHYLPPGETWPEGQRLPDLFIIVGVNALKESGIIPYRSLEAEIRVRMSDRYWRSSHSYSGGHTPPGLHFRWISSIDYAAKEIGIETASARYAAIGSDIAGGIAKNINKQLGDWAQKYSLVGKRPPEYLPDYVPTPTFSFLKEFEAERILSAPAFMKHNVTVWKIPADSVPTDLVEQVADGLRTAGWKVPEKKEASEREYQRAVKTDAVIFTAFPQRDGLMTHPGDTRPQDWYCVYEQRMTQSELTAALRAILKRGVPEPVLAQFQRWWHWESALIESYFQEHPPTLTTSLRYLAQVCIDQGRLADAREILLRASALQRIQKSSSSPSKDMKELAKQAGLEELPELPDLSALLESDLVDLREQQSATMRLEMGEPGIFLLAADDQEQEYLCLTPVGTGDNDASLRWRQITLGKGSCSFMTTTVRLSPGKARGVPMHSENGDYNFGMRAKLLPEANAVEITVGSLEDVLAPPRPG